MFIVPLPSTKNRNQVHSTNKYPLEFVFVVISENMEGPSDYDYAAIQILVPGKYIGAVIGKARASLKEIMEQSSAKVSVRPRYSVGSTRSDRLVDLRGTTGAVAAAYEAIMFKVEAEAKERDPQAVPTNGETMVPLKVLIRNDVVRHIIGKAGTTIKQLSEDSGAQISINQPEIELGPDSLRIITVSGAAVGLCAAQKLLTEKLMAISKSLKTGDGAPVLAGVAVPAGAVAAAPTMEGMMAPPMVAMMGMPGDMSSTAALYGSGAFPILGGRGERNIVLVLETMIGAVIGKGGENARGITEVSNAKIHIETREEKEQRAQEEGASLEESGARKSDERQIVVMGNPDAQFKAQQHIYQLLVREDQKHNLQRVRRMKVHFPVPSNMLGRVIGKGGAKIKELSAQSGARLDLLRTGNEQDGEETPVEIFGNFQEVQAAQNLIRQIVFEHRIRDKWER
eukprot:m.1003480 g.1003480  ORF g.1003480 m.1003480 type:complete len:454 (-) comp24044_c0_seq7:1129-2490(-)